MRAVPFRGLPHRRTADGSAQLGCSGALANPASSAAAARHVAVARASGARPLPAPTASSEPRAPIDSTEPAEAIDSTDPLDAIDSSDPADSAEAIDRNDPTEAIDSAEPSEPHESADPMDRRDNHDERTARRYLCRGWPTTILHRWTSRCPSPAPP